MLEHLDKISQATTKSVEINQREIKTSPKLQFRLIGQQSFKMDL